MSRVSIERSEVIRRLARAGCVHPEREATELIEGARDVGTLDVWLRRRERGEPLAWIVGGTTFCGHRIHIAPGVFVPRPQTEELAGRAAAGLPTGGRALDLCTGSGAVAAHLKEMVPTATVVGVDSDRRAVECAVTNGVLALVGDLDSPLRSSRSFDVLAAVPPYVPTAEIGLLPGDVQEFEPSAALDGGRDGLDVARRVVAAAGRLLLPGGRLFVELGGNQDEALAGTLVRYGFGDVSRWCDEHGNLRGITAEAGLDPTGPGG